MVQPIDQGAILASGRALVPNYAEQALREALLGIQRQNAETNALQASTEAGRQNQATQRRAEYQAALQALPQNPTARDFAELMFRHPEMSEEVRRGWQTLDENRRRTDFQSIAEVHDAARAGNYELAARQYRQRVEADRQAGIEPSPVDEAILSGLESADPQQRRFALDVLERSVAAIAGPEQYSSVYGTFSNDVRVVDDIIVERGEDGEWRPVIQSPYPRVTWGPDGRSVIYNPVPGIPTIGGNEASPRVEQAPARRDGSGGSGNPPSNNNPGGLRRPGSLEFQSFNTPEAGIAAQENLLRDRYLANGNTVRGVVERYAPRRSRGGDNTDAQVNNYIAYVARRLGINPNARITQADTQRLAAAMREFETGRRGRGVISGGPVRIRTRQQYDRLSVGSTYVAPDGSVRTKR